MERVVFLVVNTWLYKIKQYLGLVMVMNPGLALSDENRISFASTFLKETAAIWWFTLVKSNTALTTWEQFRNAIFQEFVPSDHARRAREKLRKLSKLRPLLSISRNSATWF